MTGVVRAREFLEKKVIVQLAARPYLNLSESGGLCGMLEIAVFAWLVLYTSVARSRQSRLPTPSLKLSRCAEDIFVPTLALGSNIACVNIVLVSGGERVVS